MCSIKSAAPNSEIWVMTYHSYEGVVRLLADRISQWLQRFAHVVGGGLISSRAIMPRVIVIKSGYCGRIRRLLRKVRRFASSLRAKRAMALRVGRGGS